MGGTDEAPVVDLLAALGGGRGFHFHYCNVDSPEEPSMLARSANQQGLRLFDISDFTHPREIGYFNPGGDGTKQPGSFGGVEPQEDALVGP